MPIVKQTQTAPLIREAIVLDLGDLGRQAAELRASAEARAARIIAEAQADADRRTADAAEIGRREGHLEGMQKGLEEGRQKGRAEALASMNSQLAALQQTWTQLARQWEQQRVELTLDASHAVLQLAMALAERVVRRVIAAEPGVVVDQVAAALSHVLHPVDPALRIHPEDRPLLEQAMPELLRTFSQLQHLKLVDDPTVSRGGCVLHSGQGVVDAQVDVQLRRIAELLCPAPPAAAPSEAPS